MNNLTDDLGETPVNTYIENPRILGCLFIILGTIALDLAIIYYALYPFYVFLKGL